MQNYRFLISDKSLVEEGEQARTAYIEKEVAYNFGIGSSLRLSTAPHPPEAKVTNICFGFGTEPVVVTLADVYPHILNKLIASDGWKERR